MTRYNGTSNVGPSRAKDHSDCRNPNLVFPRCLLRFRSFRGQHGGGGFLICDRHYGQEM